MVTADSRSPVARKADVVLTIDDRSVVEARKRRNEPYLPLGSLFEQAFLLVMDQAVVDLMAALDLDRAGPRADPHPIRVRALRPRVRRHARAP